MEPQDAFNQVLVSRTHPEDWINPKPASSYHLVVIGGGTAGLVTAAGAAGLGAKVALVEKNFLGGDCLNFGCVPSKALIRSARWVGESKSWEEFGLGHSGGITVDFPKIMTRMRKLRSEISVHDSAERFRSLGVDVFLGEGRFQSSHVLEVGAAKLKFKKAVIATGTHPFVPDIPGLKDAGYWTNETLFSLTELPKRLLVLGGGPIGCEMAQCFARFGSQVTLLHSHKQVLNRGDSDAAQCVEKALRRDGVQVETEAEVLSVALTSTGKQILFRRRPGLHQESFETDAVLVATGRTPNVAGLGLESAGVAFDLKQGVQVDGRLRTTQKNIFACGDVCSRFRFTHAADAMARMVIQNALFFGRKKVDDLVIPWCTYTDPEVAEVGWTEAEARSHGVEVDVFRRDLAQVDRAVLDGETEGFVKILVARGTDRIVGATCVSRHAGDWIGELVLAMKTGQGLGSLASVIHPYPTQAEAIKQCGDAYQRTRLTPSVKQWLQRWFRWF